MAKLSASFGQRRLWMLAQLDGASRAYHLPLALRATGQLDRVALSRALDRIIARHEALRTTFTFVDGELLQSIGPEDSGFLLVDHDLRKETDAAMQLDLLIRQEADAAFDMAKGPLIRGRLIAISDEEHVLLITMHHIVSDGWSMEVLTRELRTLYEAYHLGKEDPQPPLRVQYADYAAWERQWLVGDVFQAQADYWRGTLAGAPAVLELPTDRPRPAEQDYRGARVPIELNERLTVQLKTLSRRHGTTLFMTLLAAWGTLLSRLSGQTDLVIGTPVANRQSFELEELIGFFVNTLALRLDFSGGPSVSELLARVKAQTLAAQEHQDLSFDRVVEAINPPRSLAHSPLFQVMFSWENIEHSAFELPGVQLADYPSGTANRAKFDLSLYLSEVSNRVAGVIGYATALFDASTIERYVGYLRTLLQQMVEDDERTVDRLQLLSDVDRQHILVDWNDTDALYPDRCIHELFEEQVARTPEAIAVSFEGAEISFAELNSRANCLANYLRSIDIVPESRVGLCLERSLEMVVAILAVLKAGGAYVPMDPEYPLERLHFMLQDSAPAVVLQDESLPKPIERLLGQLRIPSIDVRADSKLWSRLSRENPECAGLSSYNLAYIMYTSGSTGKPKGVMVEHRSLCNVTLWMRDFFELQSSDSALQKTPLSFDAAAREIFPTLATGARLVIARSQGHRDPDYIGQLIRDEHITTMHFVPSMLQAFVNYANQAYCSSLRLIVCGGERLPGPLATRLFERLPQVAIMNVYGPTEATVDATARPCVAGYNGTEPIGRAMRNTRIYILDQQLEPVPIGVAGELHIGGIQVARGYWNRPVLTEERRIASPFVEGDRLYRTEDLARYLPDGNIEFLGRNGFKVKLRGFRIELGEIESHLALYPGIRDAVVLAREDETGEMRLVAYYTQQADAQVSIEVLRTHVMASLPEYMVPAAYVALETMPLTPTGKVDRKGLQAPGESAYVQRQYEAPNGEIEMALAEIWCDVLRMERVGRYDDFFELGGHSLLAVRMLSHVRRLLGVEVRLTGIFTHPMLADFAEIVASGSQSSLPAIVPVKRDG